MLLVGNGTYVSPRAISLVSMVLTACVALQIGFLVLTGLGTLIPMFMVDPSKMIRSDGTRVRMPRHPSWKTEFLGLWIAIRDDPWIVLLFPMFFASNWFYTWRES